jgi:hypothetical protein
VDSLHAYACETILHLAGLVMFFANDTSGRSREMSAAQETHFLECSHLYAVRSVQRRKQVVLLILSRATTACRNRIVRILNELPMEIALLCRRGFGSADF